MFYRSGTVDRNDHIINCRCNSKWHADASVHTAVSACHPPWRPSRKFVITPKISLHQSMHIYLKNKAKF